ncbi:hypothetical protein [Actinomadura fibrosa]|uniref:Transposase n=1 Tax=Actinomadura fibrosa TaxID=111802 RepID=A0ABW2XGN5_9ACTN|nr:hypothetical protein [Actinomadura fibrosa]
MAPQKEYSAELRERAVHREALRTWIRLAEVDGEKRQGTTVRDAQRIAELERENRESRPPVAHG